MTYSITAAQFDQIRTESRAWRRRSLVTERTVIAGHVVVIEYDQTTPINAIDNVFPAAGREWLRGLLAEVERA